MSDKKVVVITGAAQGIGLATARVFAEGGYIAVMLDVKKDQVEAEAEKLRADGLDADAYELDITDYKAGQKVIGQVAEKYGRIDTLFNDAGIVGVRKGLLGFDDPEEIRGAENVNLWGSIYMIQHVARVMIDKGIKGSIINVSSFVARFAEWTPFAYGVSKAGVDGLTRFAAFHLGRYGIRVNSVAPGFTKTEMAIRHDYSDPELRKAAQDSNLLNRWIEPREIGTAVYFLAGDGASAITGVKLPVDAGYQASKVDNKVNIYGENVE